MAAALKNANLENPFFHNRKGLNLGCEPKFQDPPHQRRGVGLTSYCLQMDQQVPSCQNLDQTFSFTDMNLGY